MTKQEFLSELERALGKLPHAEVEQALAFYDEAISDRMEDGLSEAEALAGLGPVDEIAAQIAAETPPIPRAIARANTGSRTLNIVLLAVFSPIWIPIVLALAAAALSVYVAIWAVIAALWAVDAVLVLMPFAGLAALASTLGGGMPLPGVFVFGPDYIFLDEATNSLDANNERNIVENLDKFYKGKTVVIASAAGLPGM